MFRLLGLSLILFFGIASFADFQELQITDSGYLGLVFQEDMAPQDTAIELPADAIISSVIADSPAEKVGFKAGDMILEVDGFGVDGGRRFSHYLAHKRPGERISCFLLRTDLETSQEITVALSAVLGTFPETRPGYPPIFGMELAPEAEKTVLKNVLAGSVAGLAKLQAGDQILELDGRSLRGDKDYEISFSDFLRSFDTQRKTSVPIILSRGGQEQKLMLQPNRKGHIGIFDAGKKGKVEIAELFPDGPAKKAGLELEDRILEVNGEALRRAQRLSEIVSEQGKGAVLDVKIQRKNQTLTISLTIGGRAGY
ncbi:MAG: PDZ domain-containing protein [Planctomycetota bacterium]